MVRSNSCYLFGQCVSLHDLFFSALSLDPEQKDQLIEVIEKLLADKTTVGLCITDPCFIFNKCRKREKHREHRTSEAASVQLHSTSLHSTPQLF